MMSKMSYGFEKQISAFCDNYEVCLKNNGTKFINVLFYLTSKFYNMSPSK